MLKVKFRAFVPADLLTVQKQLPYAMTQTTTGIVAYDPDEAETLAVFLADGWTQTSMMVHWVVLNPVVFRHKFIEEIASFGFTKAGRKKMYALIADNNRRSITVCEKIGFQQVSRLEDAVSEGVDYLVFELKRENCPYWVQPALQKVS